MELLNDLVQGSEIWLEARKSHFTASDAPAVMGASKYKTRKQLLDEKKGAVTEVITPAKQALFDKGHKAEDDARNVLSVETFDEYLPCVGVRYDIDGLPLMSSFDGRSDDEDHLFEHKLWNETLAENVRNKVLAPSHYWQLEHQLLVSEDDYVLFVVSDGTAGKREMMKYYPVDGRKEELIAAWALFQSDLESHQLEAKQEVVVAEKCSLPVIKCSVKGSQITTNISNCLVEVKALAKSEMARSFETDQDFADKDQLNKDIKKVRAELKERVANVKGEFVSYSEFEAVAGEMDNVLQQMQSHGEKQVKQAKEDKKNALKNSAMLSLSAHVAECNTLIGATFSIEQVIQLSPDWLGAMKNKRTITSIEDALDTVLNDSKLKLTEVANLIKPNFKFLQENANEYKFLFQDVFTLINQPEESFKAIVTTRINDHKEIEAKKLTEETARIEKEAKEKAEAEAVKKLEADAKAIRQQERDKVNAENKAIAEHVEAIQINAEFDEYKANQAKQKHTPPTPVHAQKVSASKQAVIGNAAVNHPGSAMAIEQVCDLEFTGDKPSVSQLQKNINAIEAQSTHVPPHVDIMNWARDYAIRSDAFLVLEKILAKHYTMK